MHHGSADENKYFKLYSKYLTGKEKNVLILGISNFSVIFSIIEAIPKAKITLYDIDVFCNCVLKYKDKFVKNNIKTVNISKDKDIDFLNKLKEETMKFDKIIMNPPYEKNLHLKILEEAIKHITDKGEIVNLSPVRWLQDPLAKYKKNSDYNKFEKSVAQHIESLDIISAEDASKIFNISLFVDLGIYKCTISSKNTLYNDIVKNGFSPNKYAIFSRIVDFSKDANLKQHIIYNLDNISVKVNDNFGGHKNPYTLVTKNHSKPYIDGVNDEGKTYAECAFKKSDVDENKQEQCTVKFDSTEKAYNFIKSVQTITYMFINFLAKRDIHVPLFFLPWLGDTENPRTHKIGYESDWTNEDLCKVFSITGYISDTEAEKDSEWEEILNTMKEFC